jgi:hypothetical protein
LMYMTRSLDRAPSRGGWSSQIGAYLGENSRVLANLSLELTSDAGCGPALARLVSVCASTSACMGERPPERCEVGCGFGNSRSREGVLYLCIGNAHGHKTVITWPAARGGLPGGTPELLADRAGCCESLPRDRELTNRVSLLSISLDNFYVDHRLSRAHAP